MAGTKETVGRGYMPPETTEQYHKRITEGMKRSTTLRELKGAVIVSVLPNPSAEDLSPSLATEEPIPVLPDPKVNKK